MLYVPSSAHELIDKIIEEFHDTPMGGHLASSKTTEKLQRNFYWTGMKDTVDAYIKSCNACQISKRRTTERPGANFPYPIQDYPFEVIAMDMKTALPTTDAGNDAVWVVVDKLTRRAHIIPCSVTCTSEQTARLILDNVVRHWGIPHRIISDHTG